MSIARIPHIVVRQVIHVHLQLTRVEVHVRNEDLRNNPSVPPYLYFYQYCILFGTKSSQDYSTYKLFLFTQNTNHALYRRIHINSGLSFQDTFYVEYQ